MKTLITGIAGTGKSTIVQELNKHGVEAIDLHDIPNLFFWEDIRTKQVVEYSKNHPLDWFENVERLCNIDMLKNILNQYENIVMAGTTGGPNQKEFLSLFDKIILLQTNPETLIYRMETRNNKSGFGKTKAEQEDNIKWQKEFDPQLLSYGAIPVNTEGLIDDVIEKIIKIIREE